MIHMTIPLLDPEEKVETRTPGSDEESEKSQTYAESRIFVDIDGSIIYDENQYSKD